MVPEPALLPIDRGCELGLYHQRICCCCTLLYCCTTSSVGKCVRRLVVGSEGGAGWWVSTRMVWCVRCSGCLTCLVVLLFSGPIMVVSPLSLDLYCCCIRHLLYTCCNTWWMGGSLRGRQCCTTFCYTAASQWVDRFVAVTVLCVPPAVSPQLRGLFFLFFLFSSDPGPALE